MLVCPACGVASPAGNRFCGACGAALVAPAAERRRLVTSVFCDLVGSTAMGERNDPEKVFELVRSYFDNARAALERHGGTVEKFIGDAVVGMFGVAEAHEDDALRACRAALEIRERTAQLKIPVRIGVNSGEVVAHATRPETFASGHAVVLGDAVNVAARLEQSAPPGEILIGDATYRLVRNAVQAEAFAPVEAKGKAEALTAYRLLEASPRGAVPRQAASPLVGRRGELALLDVEVDAARRGCRLATVLGEAGIGKSRLAAELAARIGERARIVRGACLSYGEGITFWPIAEVVRELAGIRDEDSAEKVRERVPPRIAQLLGLAEGTTSAEETLQAVAELLAGAASDETLLVLIDDIHWAEPALLELLARLPMVLGSAPVLLLCLTRPELREHRPDWPVTISLAPLGAADVDALLEGLRAPAETRVRLALAAAGNPLYAEELVAWVREGGDVDDLPTSLNALLGARLDRLAVAERAALERGAVEGELFHQGAVVELTDQSLRPNVTADLEELTRNDMIRLTAASLAGEVVAYRFKHILVRDAAYRSTTKRLRAGLHERFADWLERRAGGRVAEVDEILGYHLEQAYRYRAELGEPDPGLAARAASHLGASGARAAARADHHAAINLLDRAMKLLPEDSAERLGLLHRYSIAVDHAGRPLDAQAALVEIISRSEALGDRVVEARARTQLAAHAIFGDPTVDFDEQLGTLAGRYAMLAQSGNQTALAENARSIGMAYRMKGRCADAAEWLERALAHAHAGDDHVSFQQVTRSLAHVLVEGPLRVSAATARCTELLQSNRGDRVLEATISACLAELSAMAGHVDETRAHLDAAVRVFGQADSMLAALAQMTIGNALELTGDLEGAYRAHEARWQFFRRYADGAQDTRAIDSAEQIIWFCCRNGRWDEADGLLAQYRDVPRQRPTRLAFEALLADKRGEHEGAVRLARRALALHAGSDGLNNLAAEWLSLAEVYRGAGESAEAGAAANEARELYRRKENVTALARVALSELRVREE